MTRYTLASTLLIGLFATGIAYAQKYTFSVINDSLPQTTICRPHAVNDGGTILLQPYSGFNTSLDCLLITGSTIFKTQQYPGTDQYYSLSNNGYITGTGIYGVYYLDPEFNLNVIPVPAGDTGYPTGINNSILVVGMANSPTSGSYAWTFQKGTFSKFVYPGSTGCTLNGVNDSGDKVGTFFVDNLHTAYYGFLTVKGKAKEFAVPACIDPTPSAISNNGIVVGTAISIPTNRMIGFVRNANGIVETIDYKKNAPASIPGNGGPAYLTTYGTEVFGVNSSRVIVGMFTGFYLTSDGKWGQTMYYPFMGTPK